MRYLATLGGQEHEIEIEELAADSFAIRFGENRFEADLRRVGPGSFSVIINNRSFDFDVARDGDVYKRQAPDRRARPTPRPPESAG